MSVVLPFRHNDFTSILMTFFFKTIVCWPKIPGLADIKTIGTELKFHTHVSFDIRIAMGGEASNKNDTRFYIQVLG